MFQVIGEHRPSNPVKAKQKAKPSRALILSLVAHVIVFALAVMNFTQEHAQNDKNQARDASQKNKPTPVIMQAVFISPDVVARQHQAKKNRDALVEQQRADEEAKQKAAEQKRVASERERAKALAIQQRAEEQQKQEALAQQLAEQKRRGEAEQEKLALESERQRQAKAKEDRAAALAKKLAEQWAVDSRHRAAVDAQYVKDEKLRYQSLVTQIIMERINTAGFKGQKCDLNVRVNPQGIVLGISVDKGDSSLCLETKRAILSARSLPVSNNSAVYESMKKMDISIRI